MNHRPYLPLAFVTALALTTFLGSPASAERARARGVEPQGFAPHSTADRRISLDEATRRARRHVPGRVLNARQRGDVYEVKLLTPGNEVVTVTVDATNGDIIR